MPFYPHPARIFEVDTRYEELADCDIIVNAAGHIEAAAASRDGELFVTTDEARTFAKRISDAGFKGIWVSIANPCDVVSTEIQYLTGCDPTLSSSESSGTRTFSTPSLPLTAGSEE